MAIRHPNIVQLFGTASCGDIHAAVFHDDLIPLQQIFDLYEHLHFSTAYIYAYMNLEFIAVSKYFRAIFEHVLSETECTFFIRSSSGRICVDLVWGGRFLCESLHGSMPAQRGLEFLTRENSEAAIIDSLTLELYHEISYWHLSKIRFMWLCPSATVVILGSVFHCPSDAILDDVVEIAWLPNAKASWPSRWYIHNRLSFSQFMPDGWTRLESNDIVGTTASIAFSTLNREFNWLSQANHIFTALHISCNFQDYVDDENSEDGGFTTTNEEFDDEPDSTPVNHGTEELSIDFPADPTHAVGVHCNSSSRVATETIASNALLSNNAQEALPIEAPLPVASASTSLLPADWETSATSTAYGYGYGYSYGIQPNPYSLKSDVSTTNFNINSNFDTYSFGNNLSWLDYSVFSDAVPSHLSMNYQPPVLPDATQLFPTISEPQLPTNLPTESSFTSVPVGDALVADAPSKKRKTRDETDLANMIQGSRAQKAPKRF
ncbi:hypothetical protein MSAN_00301900 [Mycena sanguinolenta]|uniref:Uncharacterized protein n=1 Tax=Mycena sanguinolenta TaxID=230812 RepID=A0A8H7DH69_9AGAR|nr:hypothetical protein MSAN_00301900 [Mycena sanguinolenta]